MPPILLQFLQINEQLQVGLKEVGGADADLKEVDEADAFAAEAAAGGIDAAPLMGEVETMVSPDDLRAVQEAIRLELDDDDDDDDDEGDDDDDEGGGDDDDNEGEGWTRRGGNEADDSDDFEFGEDSQRESLY